MIQFHMDLAEPKNLGDLVSALSGDVVFYGEVTYPMRVHVLSEVASTCKTCGSARSCLNCLRAERSGLQPRLVTIRRVDK